MHKRPWWLALGSCLCLSLGVFAQAPADDAGFWAPVTPPRAHYTIEGRVDPPAGRLDLTESIQFKNGSPRAMNRLALNWPFDCKRRPEITVGGRPVSIVNDTGEDKLPSVLLLGLPQALSPGSELDLRIQLSGWFTGATQSQAIRREDWYPQLRWGYPTHDDYDVKLTAASGYVVATSGRPDPKTGWDHQENVRAFGIYLAKDVQVEEASAGDVLVRTVFTAKGAECARLLRETAVDVINFDRQRFGFFPYRSLTIVPGGPNPVGGYPVASALVAIHGQERFGQRDNAFWRWITAHEIGHQYWSEYVLSTEPDGLGWLVIGLGLYADREYSRRHGINSQHQKMMDGYIEGVRQGYDTTAGRTPEQIDLLDWDYNNIVEHDKGLSIISALASVTGRTTFDIAYRRALKEFAGRRMDVRDFERLCERESGQDLQWFFDQWVRSDRFLSYQIASQSCDKQPDAYLCRVKVVRLGTLQMPVPVTVTFQDGTNQTKSTDRLADTSLLSFNSTSPLTNARLDASDELALVVPPPAMTRTRLSQLINQLDWTGAGKRAAELFMDAKGIRGVGQWDWFKLGLTLYDGRYYNEALDALSQAEKLAGDDPSGFDALVWQGIVLDVLNRRGEALERYRDALEALKRDPSRKIQSDQYALIIDRAWVEARLQIPFQRR
jgi:tetratricopeptide (TPR) repeat protein